MKGGKRRGGEEGKREGREGREGRRGEGREEGREGEKGRLKYSKGVHYYTHHTNN